MILPYCAWDIRGHTEGLLYVDETFERNLENAEAAGIAVGVYFFSQATSKGRRRKKRNLC